MNDQATKQEYAEEIARCIETPRYFIETYVKIQDKVKRGWVPFTLWPEQVRAYNIIRSNKKVVILKARQLGLTWLVLADILYETLFNPISTALMFSRRDTEAIALLNDRFAGMFKRLPEWMRPEASNIIIEKDSAHLLQISNGSTVRAFPTTGGDSYAGTYAFADEFDLVPNQQEMLTAVEPTIEEGGKLVLLSRADKKKPMNMFKNIYKAAKKKENDYTAVFLPWFAHPERSAEWYEKKKQSEMSTKGTLDDLLEQYPATDLEALQGRTLDKRIPPTFLNRCYIEEDPLRDLPNGCPWVPGLAIFQPVDLRKDKGGNLAERYAIGADPAEGNPTSDPSSFTVLNARTGEEVATVNGRIQTTQFARYIDTIGTYYNRAAVLVERNNHGHAVIGWLLENSYLPMLEGYEALQEGNVSNQDRKIIKYGWFNNQKGKSLLYNAVTDAFRDGDVLLHSFATYTELASIDGSTLLAPEGMHDDRADGFSLAVVAVNMLVNNWIMG
ncbi:MAG: terminase family protein [Planctomycetes bacterium]|nr:terminase family protein [Planctomycetota bacterium]